MVFGRVSLQTVASHQHCVFVFFFCSQTREWKQDCRSVLLLISKWDFVVLWDFQYDFTTDPEQLGSHRTSSGHIPSHCVSFLYSCFAVQLPRTSAVGRKFITTTVNTTVAFIETSASASLSVYCCIIHSRFSSLFGPSIIICLLTDLYNLLRRVVVVFSTVWGCNTS